MVSAMVWLSRY